MKSKEAGLSRKQGLKNIFTKMLLDICLSFASQWRKLRSVMIDESRSYLDEHTCILYVAAVIDIK